MTRPTWTGRHVNVSQLKVGDCILTRGNNVLRLLDFKTDVDNDDAVCLTLENKLTGKVRSRTWFYKAIVFLVSE